MSASDACVVELAEGGGESRGTAIATALHMSAASNSGVICPCGKGERLVGPSLVICSVEYSVVVEC